jgi:hypothetical protein
MSSNNSSTQGSARNELKKYERSFFLKIFLSALIFATIGLLSAIAVHQILNLRIGLPPTSLDAQTIANFFIFAFATSVAFAGAWVVIQIASKQEDLANTQLNLALDQKELARAQLELTQKTTPEYNAALKAGDEAASGLLELKQKVTLLFGFYFKAHSKGASSVAKEAFQTQTVHILSGILELLQGAWILELPTYEVESKAIKMGDSTSGIVLLSNQLFLEFSNLRSVLQSKTYSVEEERSQAAFQIYGSLMKGVEVFFEAVRKIRDDFDKEVSAGNLRSFNSEEPRIAAAIHGRLSQMDLKPNFNLL